MNKVLKKVIKIILLIAIGLIEIFILFSALYYVILK